MAGERWARERINEALSIINYLKRPIFAALKPLRGVVYAHCHEEKDYRVALLEVGLPGSPPLVIVLGVVTERSRPLSPARLLGRLRRLLGARLRYGPPQADVVYYLLLASGSRLTRGAEKLARRLRRPPRRGGDAFYVVPWRRVRSELRRYLHRRLAGLIRRLREKNVKAYGRLAELLRVLYLLASRLGPVDIALADVEAAIRA